MASTEFARALERRGSDPAGRRWIYVPYDQLSDGIGPLAAEDPSELGIVLVECPAKAARRPYHKQKLALVLANQRQFALEQAARGVAVRHVVSPGGFADALEPLATELGALRVQRPAERELRAELVPLVESGALEVVRHDGWLTGEDDFARVKGPPWRMDAFYRGVRKRTGILMEDGKPLGGKYSHDADNRKAWKGEPAAPTPPRFEADAIDREVEALVDEHFAAHPGEVDLAKLPTTHADAELLWQHALETCMENFGPFEDAMARSEPVLFHTQISPLVNLHRLLPRRVIDDVLGRDLPLSSKEGFVRQVLGWREFVRHVHEATDGFRATNRRRVARSPGDGGFGRWRGEPWPGLAGGDAADGGSTASYLDADAPLPPAFWGETSGLTCLDDVVADVLRDGWSHHITRLMVLANIGSLLGVRPRELTDWFWAVYVDAYDWVVEPNVLAMGTFAVGDVMTTKPYVSGSAYLHRMGDSCGACEFDPKRTCPLTRLYWQFLERNGPHLEGNPRMSLPLRSAAKRSAEDKEKDAATLERVRATLAKGQRLVPDGS